MLRTNAHCFPTHDDVAFLYCAGSEIFPSPIDFLCQFREVDALAAHPHVKVDDDNLTSLSFSLGESIRNAINGTDALAVPD